MDLPYIAISNDELKDLPEIKNGDVIICPKCGEKHQLHAGTEKGKESDVLLFYKCGDSFFLGAIRGKCIVGRNIKEAKR